MSHQVVPFPNGQIMIVLTTLLDYWEYLGIPSGNLLDSELERSTIL
jgi:hypothetical protein